MIAAEQGQVEVVKLVLAECDLNTNTYGRTPLSFAAENGYEEVVTLLLNDERVDPDYGDYKGRTPLSFAAANGQEEVVKLLLD